MKHFLLCVATLTLIGCTQHTTSSQKTLEISEVKTEKPVESAEPIVLENNIGWPTQYVYQETTMCLQGTKQRGMNPQQSFHLCCCIFDKLQKKYTLGEFFIRKLEPDYPAEVVEIVQKQCTKPDNTQQQQIQEYNTQYWIRNENFNI
tara:strand:+ start:1575 stop:2015 length:441 start_codon:yes stop_codon:yes gene_type:complete